MLRKFRLLTLVIPRSWRRGSEQHCHFGFRPDRCEAATGRNHPLQLVVHAKLGEAGTAMDDQRDHRRADAVEDRRHPGETAKMDVIRAERSDDQKIR
jgi:hypothetical protein